ncbi:MAG: hypothetical protein J2P48_03770 [Alphaproteobacteria bacterium]|nr:hypothetical protein [Alphaproteobacteria bacterium]
MSVSAAMRRALAERPNLLALRHGRLRAAIEARSADLAGPTCQHEFRVTVGKELTCPLEKGFHATFRSPHRRKSSRRSRSKDLFRGSYETAWLLGPVSSAASDPPWAPQQAPTTAYPYRSSAGWIVPLFLPHSETLGKRPAKWMADAAWGEVQR